MDIITFIKQLLSYMPTILEIFQLLQTLDLTKLQADAKNLSTEGQALVKDFNDASTTFLDAAAQVKTTLLKLNEHLKTLPK